MQFLSRLIPQSTEQVVDNAVSVETKIAMAAIFGAGFTWLMHLPMAASISQMLGLTPAAAAGWGLAAAASTSAWLCAFLHKHVYNGNAAPVVAASIVAAVPAALKQTQGTDVTPVAVAAVVSTPVPNASAPTDQPQPPAQTGLQLQVSQTTPPTSSGSSPA